jgi:hypothetical protein
VLRLHLQELLEVILLPLLELAGLLPRQEIFLLDAPLHVGFCVKADIKQQIVIVIKVIFPLTLIGVAFTLTD